MWQWGNEAMCQCGDVAMCHWGDVAMSQWGDVAMGQPAYRQAGGAMCLATGLWIIKNLHVGEYDAGE